MSKAYSFAFNINGSLAPSFTQSMSAAQKTMASLSDKTKFLKAEQVRLNKVFDNGQMPVGKYKEHLKVLQKELQTTGESQKRLSGLINNQQMAKNNFGKQWGGLKSSLATTAIMAAPLAGMVAVAANFEAAMDKVGAITNATDADMLRLSNTARELGEKTKFTASQSAEAMSYLGMAGWKTNEILAGMPGLLDLAAAGNTDLARTADIVSDNLTAFGLSADKAQHLANIYAVTVTSTNTNVEMLGETMKYAAPVAQAFGASMEETAALAGIMANSGIKASQAGTSLRAGLIRLAGPPKMAQKALDQLGLSMEDLTAEQKEAAMALKSLGIETGNTEGPQKMALIVGQLQDRMKGLGEEERLAMAKAIFGQQAATGWLAVLGAGPEVLSDLTTSLINSDGAAEKMAKRMQGNAKGAATRLKSALESVAISIGGTFLPAVAEAGDELAAMAGGLSRAAAANPGFVQAAVYASLGVAGLTLAYKVSKVALAGYNVVKSTYLLITDAEVLATRRAGIMQGFMAVKAKGAAIAQWGLNAAMSANPVGIVIAGVVALGAAVWGLYNNWDVAVKYMTAGWTWIENAGVKVIDFYVDAYTNLPQYASYAVGAMIGFFWSLPDRVADAWQSLDGVGYSFISKASDWGKGAVDSIVSWFTDMPERLAGFATETWNRMKSSFSAGMAAGSGSKMAANASGGIYGRGAFITSFAETDSESAIPHTPNRRNIGLLAKTNEIMGNPLGGGNVNATFAPQITVQGNADTAEISMLLAQKMREFKAMLAEVQNQNRRLSYG
ncbi:phage tail tape measure protein [uncultured Phascolarctobacterium sp.]|uniref:phage tail tape measure protein n=1 Tax=uncultured Phascolarctobacterium sp. TaxID=512296 RepID=UPI0025F0D835|nr:phage tail tape measure protein [uncultured Phascolarctobacterium sp.]